MSSQPESLRFVPSAAITTYMPSAGPEVPALVYMLCIADGTPELHHITVDGEAPVQQSRTKHG